MTAHFPTALVPSSAEQPAERRSKRRLLRRAMRERGATLLSHLDYTLVDSLEIPRATCFQAEYAGKPVKLGIRASADRWIAITQSALSADGELTKVDQLVLVTFKDPKKRDVIQVWSFDATLVAEMGKKVFKASGSKGQQWLPLDDTQDVHVPSMVGGSLAKHGQLLIEEKVEWADELPLSAQAAPISVEPASGLPIRLSIEEAKAGLAAQFGVSATCIKITIEG